MKKRHWYPTTLAGKLVAVTYACTPPSLIYFQWIGYFPASWQAPILAALLGVLIAAGICQATNTTLFEQKKGEKRGGFTLIELLIVISIISILSLIVTPIVLGAKRAAYLARSKAELRAVAQALELYADANGGYPPDVNRGLPNGLEKYLSTGDWPKAPWPDSVYDWDNWAPSDLVYPPNNQPVRQISIRFCPLGDPTGCKFPNESWAQNFDYYSAVYYCISGSCRSHASEPVDHAGYCINCSLTN